MEHSPAKGRCEGSPPSELLHAAKALCDKMPTGDGLRYFHASEQVVALRRAIVRAADEPPAPTSNQEVHGDKSDDWVAGNVRMLSRDSLDHEAICVAARDRIKRLSVRAIELELENDSLKQTLARLSDEPRECTHPFTRLGIDADGIMWCVQCLTKPLVIPVPFGEPEPPGASPAAECIRKLSDALDDEILQVNQRIDPALRDTLRGIIDDYRNTSDTKSAVCEQCAGRRYTSDGLACTACNAMSECPAVEKSVAPAEIRVWDCIGCDKWYVDAPETYCDSCQKRRAHETTDPHEVYATCLSCGDKSVKRGFARTCCAEGAEIDRDLRLLPPSEDVSR